MRYVPVRTSCPDAVHMPKWVLHTGLVLVLLHFLRRLEGLLEVPGLLRGRRVGMSHDPLQAVGRMLDALGAVRAAVTVTVLAGAFVSLAWGQATEPRVPLAALLVLAAAVGVAKASTA